MFPWKLGGTSMVELAVEGAHTTRVSDRYPSPFLLFKEIFLLKFIYTCAMSFEMVYGNLC